jgi:hypothetical protein
MDLKSEIVKKVLDRRAENIENFVQEYIVRTGYNILEIELCEGSEVDSNGNLVYHWWCQKKKEEKSFSDDQVIKIIDSISKHF